MASETYPAAHGGKPDAVEALLRAWRAGKPPKPPSTCLPRLQEGPLVHQEPYAPKTPFRARVYLLLRDRSISFRWFKTARLRSTRDYTINYRFDFISSIARRSRARSYPSRTARPKASEDFASSPR